MMCVTAYSDLGGIGYSTRENLGGVFTSEVFFKIDISHKIHY